MRTATLSERRRIYLLARAVVARHYRRPLTVEAVSRALASSPRQLQRAYAQFGETTFQEDLLARRMAAARELLAEQSIPVSDVACLVGYRPGSHFARAFRRRHGIAPACFRERVRRCALDRRRNADGFSHHGGPRGDDRGGASGPSEPLASIQVTQGEHHSPSHLGGDRPGGRR